MDRALRRRLVEAMANTIAAHEQELTDIDSAAGDGDHGINMHRGFQAIMAKLDEIADKPLPAATGEVGRTLVMTVGGASGAVFGTAFLALGKALPETPTRADVARGLDQAIAAVKARGRSDVGQKTMLDVLAPVAAALHAGEADIAGVARRAAEATADIQAVRGRASFVGERSLGHMDAGARSAALLVEAIADTLREAP